MLIVIFALLSCNRNDNIKITFMTSYCKNIDSIHLNLKMIKSFKITNLNEEPTVFYFNELDSSINFYSLNKKDDTNAKQKYYLKEVLTKSILDSNTEWLIVSLDTIFAFSMTNEKVYMFNVNDQIIDSFQVYDTDISRNYVCFSSPMSSMKYSDNNLVLPANSSVSFDVTNNEYFAIAGVIVNITNKSITKFGRFSNSRIYNTTSYTNPYDDFDIYGNNIIFSSEEDHYIYQYNIETEQYNKFNCRSSYIDTIPLFRDSCAFNKHAIIDYSKSNPRYGMIRYCPYNDYIYRLVRHRVKLPKNEGLYKEEMPDVKYSVIILDTNFNKIGEIVLKKNNSFNFILPINGNIVFINKKSTLKQNSNLCIDLFKIE